MRELRTLLPKEQEIVRKLAELKGDCRPIDLQNYQAGRVLKKVVGFNFAAIKWDVNKQEPIYVFYEKSEDKDEALSSYFSLCDFLYLLEDLENAGLITIQSASFDEDRIIYDRNEHNKEEFDNWLFKQEQMGFSYAVPGREIQTYRIDVVDYLEHFIHLKIIYPRPALFEYVASGFKTIEQKRHEEEMNNLKEQLTNTRKSANYAFATLLATLFLGIIGVCCGTRIKSHDLESIAKSFQYMDYSQQPNNATIQASDTIEAIDTLSTDNCNKSTPATIDIPISSKQSEPAIIDLQNDTSIITNKSITKDEVVIMLPEI